MDPRMDTRRSPSPRHDRTARLLGLDAMERLAEAHVVVLGVGGVGSFTAEALVRAGVGRVTIVDGERVDETRGRSARSRSRRWRPGSRG
jgi:tRNA A37 threonylcarbamoyladenosine dehydratase